MRHNRSEYIANLQLSPRGSLPIAQPRRLSPRARREHAAGLSFLIRYTLASLAIAAFTLSLTTL